jgi:hypothetical protein
LANVDEGDAGDYRCAVGNYGGSVLSRAAHLSLNTLVRPDFDADHDVDQSDFGHLQVCFSGVGVVYGNGCDDANLDLDADVDEFDLLIFRQCVSGPTLAADPRCAD